MRGVDSMVRRGSPRCRCERVEKISRQETMESRKKLLFSFKLQSDDCRCSLPLDAPVATIDKFLAALSYQPTEATSVISGAFHISHMAHNHQVRLN